MFVKLTTFGMSEFHHDRVSGAVATESSLPRRSVDEVNHYSVPVISHHTYNIVSRYPLELILCHWITKSFNS